MKTNFKPASLAVAIGLLSLGAVTENVYAGAYTNSASAITLSLKDSTGTTIIDASAFSFLNFQNTSSDAASLTGAVPASVTNPIIFSGDSPLACVGNCTGVAENNFAFNGTTNQYSRSDTNLSGAIITGLPGLTAPATANTLSEISLTSTNPGAGSNGNVNNNSSFTFVLANDPNTGLPTTKQIMLDLSGTVSSLTSMTADVALGLAKSTTSWQATITNAAGTVIFDWKPDGTATGGLSGATGTTLIADTLNTALQTTCSVAGCISTATSTGIAQALTPFLNTGEQYTFALGQTATSQASVVLTSVPEPSIIGLMGVGLLGVGASRLKRIKAA